MNRLAYVVILGAWAFLCTSSPARVISLRGEARTLITNGTAQVELELANRGGEPAFGVEVRGSLQEQVATAGPIPMLSTDRVHTVSLTFDPAPEFPGTYATLIRLSYTDGRGTPFSVVQVFPLLTSPDLDQEPVVVDLPELSVLEKDPLRVDFATAYTDTIRGTLRLVVPGDLACPDPVQEVLCPPLENIRTYFELEPGRAARPGSDYAVFALLEYVREGRHHVTIGSGYARVPPRSPGTVLPGAACAAALLLLAVAARCPASAGSDRRGLVFDLAVLAVLTGFIACQFPVRLLFIDTTTVGGDTVAHNYLAGHLRTSLFGAGQIVSWAPGWWCGFPAFQFYFCLPYVLTAVLSLLVPFNIAFKLVSVAGIFLLPPCAYGAGRLARLPRPVPILLAIAALPLLFDDSHTMWGVNIYSTLAGMISNSLSFPIMLLFMGSACRDMDDRRFRCGSAFLLVALLASHFFTSIMAIGTMGVTVFCRPRTQWRDAFRVLLCEVLLGLLLMAWWIVPLVAKRPYSVDFGVNWPVNLLEKLPRFLWFLLPLSLAAVPLSVAHKARYVTAAAVLLAAALVLFQFGYGVSPVFVNVRLWPFVVYAVLALAAGGLGLLLQHRGRAGPAVVAALLLTLVFGIGRPNHVYPDAQWNYSGLERKPAWPLLRDLVTPLRGTPGRLANDLHSDNEQFGSSRIFELAPHLVDKPVLEGGIVNSAIGSLFAYYIQGETSASHAGAPPIVRPPRFHPANATRHLRLFNVRHFIARWPGVKRAFARSPDWRSIRRAGDWELFELTYNDGRYVTVSRHLPVAVRTRNWKRVALDWMDVAAWLDRPFLLLSPGDPAARRHGHIISEEEFDALVAAARAGNPNRLPTRPLPLPEEEATVIEESVTDRSIRFRTRAVGAPHLIKMSYFPNWKVRGAARVYHVTPAFMLVYPEREEVELYYGATVSDTVGRAGTVLGLGIVVILLVRGRARRTREGATPG